MRTARLLISTSAIVVALSVGALAQTQQQDHQQHHPAGAATQPQTPPAASGPAAPPAAPQASPVTPPGHAQMPMGQMMQGMPEQCRAMMQNMPAGCMTMMQGGRSGSTSATQPHPANQSAATKAYMDAAERMHGPMMEGLQAGDPDVAFVRGMIGHHQGAIEMAKVLLQFGKDAQTKKWANDVIREQEREITEMQDWLKKQGR